jgi:hypothetical protein
MVWSIPYAAPFVDRPAKFIGVSVVPFMFRRSAQASTASKDGAELSPHHVAARGALSPEADNLVKVDWDAYGNAGQEARRRLKGMSLEDLGLK